MTGQAEGGHRRRRLRKFRDKLALPDAGLAWLVGAWERSPARLRIAMANEALQREPEAMVHPPGHDPEQRRCRLFDGCRGG